MCYNKTTNSVSPYGRTINNMNVKQVKRSHNRAIAITLGKHNNVNSLSQSWVESFSRNRSKKGTKPQHE